MGTSSKFVKHTGGETLVFHDSANDASWTDAIGLNTRKWEMRNGTNFETAKEYTVTVIGTTPTIVQGVTAGVKALVTTSATQFDSLNLQVVGTPFQLAAGHPCYFGAKVAFDSATLGDWFLGLCSTDTTIFAAGSDALDVDASCAGFYGSASSVVNAYNEIHANGVTTASATALTTDAHTFEFVYDGVDGIDYFHNGVLVGRHTTYIPTVVMTPSFALKASTGVARIARIQWMKTIQLA
jgi:hypothetical protein